MSKAKLLENFFDLSLKIKRLMSQGGQDQPITLFQLRILSFIGERRDCTPGQVAEAFYMSSSAVAQLIDRLLVSEFITRENDSEDRRIFRLRLTPKGREEINRLKKAREKSLKLLTKHLDEKDLAELIHILQKVCTAMEKEKESNN